MKIRTPIVLIVTGMVLTIFGMTIFKDETTIKYIFLISGLIVTAIGAIISFLNLNNKGK